MKTHPFPIVRFLASAIAVGVAATAATAVEEKGVQRVETRIVVDSDKKAGIKREPVTFLGVEVDEAPPALAAQLRIPEGQGLVVKFVEPDSPAAKAGIEKHDVLLKLDDQMLIGTRQLSVLVRNRKEGDTVSLTFMHAGAEKKASATLVKREMPVKHGFRWMQGGDLMPELHTGMVAPLPGEFVGRLHDRFGSAGGGHFQFSAPGAPPATGFAPAHKVMIFRPTTNIVSSDDSGSLELIIDDDVQTLRAKDANGELIFDGPVTTPEQRKALPEDLRTRLEKLETLEIAEPPAPPVPAVPAVPGVPALAPEAPEMRTIEFESGGTTVRNDAPKAGLSVVRPMVMML